MNIIIFTENNRAGGMDTFYTNLIKSWPNVNDKFIFICNKGHPGLKYLDKEFSGNLKIIKHSIILNWDINWVNRINFIIIQKIIRKLLVYLLLPYQFISIKKLLNNYEASSLISVNGAHPGGQTTRLANIAWKSLNKGKSIYSLHGLSLYNVINKPSKLLIFFEKYMTTKLIKSTDSLVCVSNACANSLNDHPGYINDKTKVISNGINLEQKASNLNLKDLLKLNKDTKILLMLAGYHLNKGHSHVFKAMNIVLKKHPDCHLVMCGDSKEPEKDIIQDELEKTLKNTENIHLLDYVPNASALIEQADILLIATQTTEAFGLTALEAMKYKKPIVSTDVDALRETIGQEGYAGYCCKKNDYTLYAQKIIYLLDNPSIRNKMGLNGNKRLKERFDSKKMSKEYQSLLSK